MLLILSEFVPSKGNKVKMPAPNGWFTGHTRFRASQPHGNRHASFYKDGWRQLFGCQRHFCPSSLTAACDGFLFLLEGKVDTATTPYESLLQLTATAAIYHANVSHVWRWAVATCRRVVVSNLFSSLDLPGDVVSSYDLVWRWTEHGSCTISS